MENLQFWGTIAGILGFVVGILALVRDTFDFKLKWSDSHSTIKRFLVDRRFQTVIVVLLLSFSYWALYSRIRNLETQKILAYATQTPQAVIIATTEDNLRKLSAEFDKVQPTINALETRVAQPILKTTARQPKILVDIRHNPNNSFMSLEAGLNSYDFIKSESSEFNKERLTAYDVLVIEFLRYKDRQGNPIIEEQQRFTDGEIDAIKGYINQGGSVFLIGLGFVWMNGQGTEGGKIEEYPLNKISNSYGIFFSRSWIESSKELMLFNSELVNHQHPIIDGINTIALPTESSPGVLTIDDPAEYIVKSDLVDTDKTTGSVVIAAAKLDKGKLVCLHHPNFLYGAVDPKYDNQKLLKNILNWLVQH